MRSPSPQNEGERHKEVILWSKPAMEKLMETGFVGVADYIDRQESWVSPEWQALNQEFATVVVDDLLDFLWEYYLPL